MHADILCYPDLIIIDIYSLSYEDVVVEVPVDFPTKVCHKLGVLVGVFHWNGVLGVLIAIFLYWDGVFVL